MTDSPGLSRSQRGNSLAARLRSVRLERFGDRSKSEFARQVGVPWRVWANYESGMSIPGEVMLAFLEVTGAETTWLLRGEGPIYRSSSEAGRPPVNSRLGFDRRF